jgi:hypothetical protein
MKERKKKPTFNQRPNQRTNETLVGIDDDDSLNLFDFLRRNETFWYNWWLQ